MYWGDRPNLRDDVLHQRLSRSTAPFRAEPDAFSPVAVQEKLLGQPEALRAFLCSSATFYSGLPVSVSQCAPSEFVFLVQEQWLEDTIAWLTLGGNGSPPNATAYPRPHVPLRIFEKRTFVVITQSQLQILQAALNFGEVQQQSLVQLRVDVGAALKGGIVVDFRPALITVVGHRRGSGEVEVVKRDVWVLSSWTLEQLRCASLGWCCGRKIDGTSNCATQNWR